MRKLVALLLLLGFTLTNRASSEPNSRTSAAERLISVATNSSVAFERLTYMCDRFGPRFSGSTNLEAATDWVLAEMKKDGLQNVRGEEVRVPHWIRGHESGEVVAPINRKLHLLGLGGTIETPPGGITADVLVVTNFADLQARANEAAGKIVLFNQPFTTYGETVPIRSRGAIEAAKAGAVASLIRSVSPFGMQTPHTGAMRYDETLPKIPHAAITIEDAEFIARTSARGESVRVHLVLGGKTLRDATSRNVVAEIPGSERPEEIVLIGGHIDSWDVGTGAMDDGGGCLASWEALRLIRELRLRPKRTIRVVLFTNEENGLRGALGYADQHKEEIAGHVCAIESDDGTFQPLGFNFTGPQELRCIVEKTLQLLAPIGPMQLHGEAGGADLTPLLAKRVPGMDLVVDRTKYFWYHHTDADTIDKLDRNEFNRCVAALAVMAYAIADGEFGATVTQGVGR